MSDSAVFSCQRWCISTVPGKLPWNEVASSKLPSARPSASAKESNSAISVKLSPKTAARDSSGIGRSARPTAGSSRQARCTAHAERPVFSNKVGIEARSTASEASIVSRLHASINEENEAAHEEASVSTAYDLPLTTTGKLAWPALAISPCTNCAETHRMGTVSSLPVSPQSLFSPPFPEACIANDPKASWLSA
eukprot:scaffold118154_cov63-Phaeocystis_antarctica.AAC.3